MSAISCSSVTTTRSHGRDARESLDERRGAAAIGALRVRVLAERDTGDREVEPRRARRACTAASAIATWAIVGGSNDPG